MASDENKNSRKIATEYISHSRFHQRFSLPQTAIHGELRITYSDVGIHPEKESIQHVPTFLFIPGMFGSRYLGVFLHAIAEKLGVRVLIVDRPGMGGSTSVPDQSLISIWIELVPRLLAHLSINHVGLIAHSAGTIYLLNTLFYCRHVLHPEHPYVAMLAPWVDPAHSHVTSMQLARLLPTKIFSCWNRIPAFFLTSPVAASSGAVIGNMKEKLFGSDDDLQERKRLHIEQEYGIARDVQIELGKNVNRFLFQENTAGANSQALQCLKKGNNWGKCDDYAQFVIKFAEIERVRDNSFAPGKIKVQTYFADTDQMIQKTGQSYFERCFSGFDDVLYFSTTTVLGEDHDSICTSPEVLEKIFRDAR